MIVPQNLIDQAVRAALAEDAPWGDLTSQTFIPESAIASALLAAREPGVCCGAQVFTTVMGLTDARISTVFHAEEGERFDTGDTVATVIGPARSVLQAERVALNFMQRMSGIATLTAKYVAEIAGTRARIVDTRKTTPGLRVLERYAVRCGGGMNHRFSLSDAVMVKDNHLAVLTASSKLGVTEALREARSRLPHTVHFEVEVDRIDQIEPVLAAGVDTIMLDNFTLEELRQGVALVAGRALVEASGSVRLETVGDIARTGVDIISVGALTHSVRALDLGLDIEIEAVV
ncbi:carboxylating nicotinate-nucleotide diphosphorylase [Granulicella mallensis]|uniref:Probable nicotinate-nucleotide pyrophosphorylase [carboxylating] n=1 Tax=Granulicella mallensis (strain ATCC BAA-1857 / DSM 23137 / MP5ACTX8) TaxID=682795 RepID=G8P0T5_GRAMM|nr:carboxylating nicotinate-nucleotide diphosphorylase [Granulicella mallensis]AEU35782.1 nicotinate-nucleotide pyrophosphorylase [Granulicella mallensis MP5ACTX8]